MEGEGTIFIPDFVAVTFKEGGFALLWDTCFSCSIGRRMLAALENPCKDECILRGKGKWDDGGKVRRVLERGIVPIGAEKEVVRPM